MNIIKSFVVAGLLAAGCGSVQDADTASTTSAITAPDVTLEASLTYPGGRQTVTRKLTLQQPLFAKGIQFNFDQLSLNPLSVSNVSVKMEDGRTVKATNIGPRRVIFNNGATGNVTEITVTLSSQREDAAGVLVTIIQ
jgi:hypothetical protein